MKLRIKGDALRLRLSRTEVTRLVKVGSVAEVIHFAPGSSLEYSVATGRELGVTYAENHIAITLSAEEVKAWAQSDEDGIYGEAGGALTVTVEKDFACLDRNDAENADTFPNPKSTC
ncbi:MAG: hypothetical protein P4L10_04565 [Acidobacteriaceae bacterium]|jgi:hypothetical protein|nr:hypothetical protein [Acidobacteriaceae bacterium]